VTETVSTAIGFAPHSGWAAAVGAYRVEGGFCIVARARIELTDPDAPDSKQPYHTLRDLPIDEAVERLAEYEAAAKLMATEGIQRLTASLTESGHRVVGVGILESSGRKGSSLSEILSSHPLIHTADGDHFRRALEGAAIQCGLTVARQPARTIEARAAAAAGIDVSTLKERIKMVGREVGPPWRADQKSAALLAWLVLLSASAD
jgi:hypothetical protein